MNSSNHMGHGPISDAGIASALRNMSAESAPEGAWKGVLERYEGERLRHGRRRRYWGGGLAVAASLAVAVVGLQLGVGTFTGDPSSPVAGSPDPHGMATPESAELAADAGGMPADFGQQLEQMDMGALIAFSQYQEERLRALPMIDLTGPGQVVEVGSFGLTTELEDQIALLDEGLIPASMNSGNEAVPRMLLWERALLMEDLFDLRRAEAAQAGFIYADF